MFSSNHSIIFVLYFYSFSLTFIFLLYFNRNFLSSIPLSSLILLLRFNFVLYLPLIFYCIGVVLGD